MRYATRHSVFVVIALVMALGVACGTDAGNGEQQGGAQQLTVGFCDAKAVLDASCTNCHGTMRLYGAPMSLTSYAELMAPAVTDPTRRVIDLIGVRIHDTVKPMPQPPFTITPQGIATLDAYIAAGAPAPLDPTCTAAVGGGTAGVVGNPVGTAGTTSIGGTAGVGGELTAGTSGGTAGVGGELTAGTSGGTAGTGAVTDEWPADCEERFTFTAHTGSDLNSKYTVAGGQESHPQFYFDPPWGTDQVQAVKFRAITDNLTVLHHWILYGGGSGLGDAHLTGWAPGKEKPSELPPDVGMYLPNDGSQLRLDIHYNNVGSGATQQDASGVEVCITRTLRAHTAGVIGLTASASSGAGQMITNKATCTAQITGGPVHLMSVSPHMHKLGTYSALRHTVGTSTMTLHEGPFSFEDQQIYPLNDHLVNNGEKLTTECTYNNNTAKNVGFGQSTSDEMCFNFTVYWPFGSMRCSSGGLGF